MASEIVIDTNVWVMADYENDPETLEALTLLDCADNCRRHLGELRKSNQNLVVDHAHKILSKYRDNIRGRLAKRILNELEQTGRILYQPIEFDQDGYAVLPYESGLGTFDPEDRKFVAVALRRDPHPPIYNATDSDWAEHAEALAAAGLHIVQLCPELPPRHATTE